MRDIPFWFSFMAAGALTAMSGGFIERSMRISVLGALLIAYLIYAAVRVFGIRRRRSVRFDRLLRLCRAALLLAVHCAAAVAVARRDRLGQLLHLSLAHLYCHGAARSRRARSVRGCSGSCDYIWPDRLVQCRRPAVRSAGCLSTRVTLAGGLRHAAATHPALSARAIRRTAVPTGRDDRMDPCRRRTHAGHHHTGDGDA